MLGDEKAPYSEAELHVTSARNAEPTEFPTLNVDSIGETSTADTLERTEQCAIVSTIELKVHSNTSLSEASEILDKAGDVMVSMGYLVIHGPEEISNTNHIILARFRRTFGDEDIKNLGGN